MENPVIYVVVHIYAKKNLGIPGDIIANQGFAKTFAEASKAEQNPRYSLNNQRTAEVTMESVKRELINRKLPSYNL